MPAAQMGGRSRRISSSFRHSSLVELTQLPCAEALRRAQRMPACCDVPRHERGCRLTPNGFCCFRFQDHMCSSWNRRAEGLAATYDKPFVVALLSCAGASSTCSARVRGVPAQCHRTPNSAGPLAQLKQGIRARPRPIAKAAVRHRYNKANAPGCTTVEGGHTRSEWLFA
jgi:hypothetical protein